MFVCHCVLQTLSWPWPRTITGIIVDAKPILTRIQFEGRICSPLKLCTHILPLWVKVHGSLLGSKSIEMPLPTKKYGQYICTCRMVAIQRTMQLKDLLKLFHLVIHHNDILTTCILINKSRLWEVLVSWWKLEDSFHTLCLSSANCLWWFSPIEVSWRVH